MTLEQILREMHALMLKLQQIQHVFMPQFDNGIEIFNGNQIRRSDLNCLKAVAASLLELFNAFSALKREAIALSKKNMLAICEKEVIGLNVPNLSYFKISIKDAMNAHTEVDDECAALCVDSMHECDDLLKILTALYNTIKDYEILDE